MTEQNEYYNSENDEQLKNFEDLNKTLEEKMKPIAKQIPIGSYEVDRDEYLKTNKFNNDEDELFEFTYRDQKPKNTSETMTEEKKKEVEIKKDPSDTFEEDSLDSIQEEKNDVNFMIYKNNLAIDPMHVIRYCFSGKSTPLFFTQNNKFDLTTIPKCEECGAKRHFEFQINSNILNELEGLCDLEWGVISIFSCSKACQSQKDYVEEVVLAQYESDLAIKTFVNPDEEEEHDMKNPHPKINSKTIKDKIMKIEEENSDLENENDKDVKGKSKKTSEKQKDAEVNEDDWN